MQNYTSRIALSLMFSVAMTASNAQNLRVWSAPLSEGKCANGDDYKLQPYRQAIDGRVVNGYAYEGPLGQGTVLSNLPAEQAVRHVCKEAALPRWLPDDGDDQ